MMNHDERSEFLWRPTRWLLFSQMLVSLALAVIFWSTLIIAPSEILEKIITVPVGYIASPPNLILVGDKQKEIRLHLAGPKSDLDSIDLAQLSAKIDLSKFYFSLIFLVLTEFFFLSGI